MPLISGFGVSPPKGARSSSTIIIRNGFFYVNEYKIILILKFSTYTAGTLRNMIDLSINILTIIANDLCVNLHLNFYLKIWFSSNL